MTFIERITLNNLFSLDYQVNRNNGHGTITSFDPASSNDKENWASN